MRSKEGAQNKRIFIVIASQKEAGPADGRGRKMPRTFDTAAFRADYRGTPMNRRDFIKMTAVGAGAALTKPPALTAQSAPAPRPDTMVGMPISAAPLGAPDFDRQLADMRQRGGVNALFPFIYTHELHRSGLDLGNFSGKFRGGNYAIPHMEYYKDTILTYEDMRAPEFGDKDLFAAAIPAAHREGIKMFAWLIEDNHCPTEIPHWEKLYEVDFHGRRATGHPSGPCKNNPYYRGYLLNLVEDYIRSYPIDGIMWGAERQSGFLNALNTGDSGRATCFCEFCQKKAKDAGIDVERARRGFGELEVFMRARKAGQRPRDGYLSSFWRILLNHPELLAWENLWVRGRHELEADLHRKVKSINPALPIGWHVWQNVTFSPLQRAEEDYGVMKEFSDFVRPAVYNNCAGERFHAWVNGSLGAVYGDLPVAETMDVLYRQLGFQEAPYDQVTKAGFSADYVERETRRAVEGVAGSATQVWPGVDIDVPVPESASQCTPAGVKAAVQAVFKAGATGIILSRNYVEMKPEHLSAAGDGLRELGLI